MPVWREPAATILPVRLERQANDGVEIRTDEVGDHQAVAAETSVQSARIGVARECKMAIHVGKVEPAARIFPSGWITIFPSGWITIAFAVPES